MTESAKLNTKIVLASASPGRAALLKQLGITFHVARSDIDEKLNATEDPRRQALDLSREKAAAAAAKYRNAIVIAADTLGLFEGEVIGKPTDAADAGRMLKRLSGNIHTVITGLTVTDTGSGKTISSCVETRVHIKELSDDEIAAYIKTGEPLNKAGAYGIQGLGGALVDWIEGDYSNVVGLPLSCLAGILKDFGISVI
jgi:septum formation protein